MTAASRCTVVLSGSRSKCARLTRNGAAGSFHNNLCFFVRVVIANDCVDATQGHAGGIA